MRKQEYTARAIDCLCFFFHWNLLNCHYITIKSSYDRLGCIKSSEFWMVVHPLRVLQNVVCYFVSQDVSVVDKCYES